MLYQVLWSTLMTARLPYGRRLQKKRQIDAHLSEKDLWTADSKFLHTGRSPGFLHRIHTLPVSSVYV